MTDHPFTSVDQFQDIETRQYADAAKAQPHYDEDELLRALSRASRENARTPMQWDGSRNAGFTSGDPWRPVNPNAGTVNAKQAVADEDSVFHYYRKLVALRKEYDIFRDGWFELIDPDNEKVFAYTRDTDTAHMLVVCNFSPEAQDWKLPWNYVGAKKLIGNYPDDFETLRPYEAYICYYEDIKE